LAQAAYADKALGYLGIHTRTNTKGFRLPGALNAATAEAGSQVTGNIELYHQRYLTEVSISKMFQPQRAKSYWWGAGHEHNPPKGGSAREPFMQAHRSDSDIADGRRCCDRHYHSEAALKAMLDGRLSIGQATEKALLRVISPH